MSHAGLTRATTLASPPLPAAAWRGPASRAVTFELPQVGPSTGTPDTVARSGVRKKVQGQRCGALEARPPAGTHGTPKGRKQTLAQGWSAGGGSQRPC